MVGCAPALDCLFEFAVTLFSLACRSTVLKSVEQIDVPSRDPRIPDFRDPS